MSPTVPCLITTGFGIVVVDATGSLVAYGSGIPPDFVVDSGGAETWALKVAVSASIVTPTVITDCLGLIKVAEAGAGKATCDLLQRQMLEAGVQQI